MFVDVLVVLKLLVLIKAILESSGNLSAVVALRLLAMVLRGENA
jgi:hypothetical protein